MYFFTLTVSSLGVLIILVNMCVLVNIVFGCISLCISGQCVYECRCMLVQNVMKVFMG